MSADTDIIMVSINGFQVTEWRSDAVRSEFVWKPHCRIGNARGVQFRNSLVTSSLQLNDSPEI